MKTPIKYISLVLFAGLIILLYFSLRSYKAAAIPSSKMVIAARQLSTVKNDASFYVKIIKNLFPH